MKLYKRYVSVIQRVDKNGYITPLSIVWENDIEYTIDKILEIRNAVSEVGGCGVLYRCRIGGSIRNLYYERTRWFLESTKP
ncbi:MAG: hypothetical protein RSC10_07230 [Longicatena sp.]